MQSLRQLWTISTQLLKEKGVDRPQRQAEELLSDALGLSSWTSQLDRLLSAEEQFRCQEWLTRRLQGEPLAYIRGYSEFYHCWIGLTSAVLIPRQETEILVDKMIHVLAQRNLEGLCLWDICTGSGCIGIALKKRFPALQVTLSDLSLAALEVAASNAHKNGVEVEVVQGDLLQAFEGRKAHFVVCNPPYIAESEYLHLEHEVRCYEPRLALVGGEKGIEFYQRLAAALPAYLYPAALVWFEIGYQQGEAVKELFCPPFWKRREVEKDWAGHDRFFFLENE